MKVLLVLSALLSIHLSAGRMLLGSVVSPKCPSLSKVFKPLKMLSSLQSTDVKAWCFPIMVVVNSILLLLPLKSFPRSWMLWDVKVSIRISRFTLMVVFVVVAIFSRLLHLVLRVLVLVAPFWYVIGKLVFIIFTFSRTIVVCHVILWSSWCGTFDAIITGISFNCMERRKKLLIGLC